MSINTVKAALRTRALADAAVSARIGDRWYNGRAPANVQKPYVVLSTVSDTPELTHDDAEGTAKPFGPTVFQIDAFGADADSADLTIGEIRARLEGTKFTEGSTAFGSISVDTERDIVEGVTKPTGTSGVHRRLLQIRTIVNQTS